jgi:hypothetical protein
MTITWSKLDAVEFYDGSELAAPTSAHGEMHGMHTRGDIGYVCYETEDDSSVIHSMLLGFNHAGGTITLGTPFADHTGSFFTSPDVKETQENEMGFVADDTFIIHRWSFGPDYVSDIDVYHIATDLTITRLATTHLSTIGDVRATLGGITIMPLSQESGKFLMYYPKDPPFGQRMRIGTVNTTTGAITFGAYVDVTYYYPDTWWVEAFPGTFVLSNQGTQTIAAFKVDTGTDTITEGAGHSYEAVDVSMKITSKLDGWLNLPWAGVAGTGSGVVLLDNSTLTFTNESAPLWYETANPLDSPDWSDGIDSGGFIASAGHTFTAPIFYVYSGGGGRSLFGVTGEFGVGTEVYSLESLAWYFDHRHNGFSSYDVAPSTVDGDVLIASTTGGTPSDGLDTTTYPIGHLYLTKLRASTVAPPPGLEIGSPPGVTLDEGDTILAPFTPLLEGQLWP